MANVWSVQMGVVPWSISMMTTSGGGTLVHFHDHFHDNFHYHFWGEGGTLVHFHDHFHDNFHYHFQGEGGYPGQLP